LALYRFANGVNVGQVLRTTRCELSCYKVCGRNEECCKSTCRIDHAFHAPLPRGFKINAGDVGKNIEAAWIAPEAEKLPRSAKSSGEMP
jgi:hypothetical protein